ncbi:putative PurR-regulated permease PerM [Actinoplanes lutulentus]|uniref:Uncharacterized protein DUF20 n=1 Tax=Actinoplanes lutulentus TaxID=1287878 RepID=A0A327ZNS3_9ACTN|nr:AI-2E family transporter [Actinoplanes lutulentus]MBB2940653.1 putative PurR-regulated permease PerM [Actinoplanes lutulentus]RAK42964.1 uncharacterized protein DUF20 [Actinoplanes lutulentus]
MRTPELTSADRLRSAGSAAWSLVGITLLALAVALVLALLRPLVLALVIALFLAVVFVPLVDAMTRRGLPRPLGAVAATLIVVALGAATVLLVVGGLVSQQPEISQHVDDAVMRLQSVLSSAGFGATTADTAAKSVGGAIPTLLAGLVPALGSLFGAVANTAIGVLVALLTCFFLLKDGRAIAARVGARLPVSGEQGSALLDQAAGTIRRYFLGLTLLGVFNAAVVPSVLSSWTFRWSRLSR